MSIVEALIAAGILAFTISIGSYLIIQSHKSSAGLVGGSLCKVRSEMLVQTFSNSANKTNISNWVYTGGNQFPSGTPWVNHPELGFVLGGTPSTIVSPTPPGKATNINNLPIVSANETNGWELIDSSVNWALYLMSTYPTFCNVSAGDVGPSNFGQSVGGSSQYYRYPATPPSFAPSGWNGLAPIQGQAPSVLNNEIDYLNIRLVTSSGTYGCPGRAPPGGGTPFPTSLVPSGQNSSGLPGANMAIEIVGSIVYTPPGAVGETTSYCQTTAKIKLDSDNSPPVFKDPRTVPNPLIAGGSVYCGPGPKNLMCVTSTGGGFATPVPSATPPDPMACNPTGGVSVAFQVSEPGSVFACSIGYSTTAGGLPAPGSSTLYVCGSPASATGPNGVPGGVNIGVRPYGSAYGNYVSGSGELLTISAVSGLLPEGYYRIFVRAYDSAQNSSDQYVDFQVSETNSGMTINPPWPFIDKFGVAVSQRNHLVVNPPWKATFSPTFNNTLFQCAEPNGSDYWTLTPAGTPPSLFPPTAIWTVIPQGTPFVLGGGVCVGSVNNPLNLPSGNYTMSAMACDPCGGPLPSTTPVTLPWVVDKAPAPTPVHSPGGTPPNFNFSIFPTWTFLNAKPTPLPEAYSCEQVPPTAPQFSSVVPPASCAPAGFPVLAGNPQPCTGQGSYGFCSLAIDGCGNLNVDAPTEYQIVALQGQNCCNVPCNTGLTCAMDHSANRGNCVLNVACTKDSDCAGGGTCYLSQGLCYGAGVGPAPQTCAAMPTPGPSPTPGPPPTPVPTPRPTPSAECSVEAISMGYDTGNCTTSSFCGSLGGTTLSGGTGGNYGCKAADVCCGFTSGGDCQCSGSPICGHNEYVCCMGTRNMCIPSGERCACQ